MKCKRLWRFGMAAALVCAGLPGMTVPAQEIWVQEESVEAVREMEGDYQYETYGDGTLGITQYMQNSKKIKLR